MASRILLAIVLSFARMAVAAESAPEHPSAQFGQLLFKDDFREGLGQWHVELEKPGVVAANIGMLNVDVPAGATLWFKPALRGPVAIVFEAMAVSAGGRNDRVSDLNCFWMARNRDGVSPVYARKRSGKFDDYNNLLTYYVGLGGNSNTTTRFRRYIGDPVTRPLLPEHDLSSPETLLKANRWQTITVIARGTQIEYWRNNERLIQFTDDEPYREGWFALRTTQSHLRLEKFRVYALK
ncbi:hypothetical protein HNQ60_002544 [Povalibacter uvarum]|uniref:DUF6250 domain-containing protein n=1 Tax=Povalibacter uvarum TaxID=732238 RepID=A0A841HLN9_9GAMM|nr:DUF6250 domain-containing protein [Povalibacter uvarum]MBB6093663.1 hypothetical protein [Povalibacter uvarum]